VSVVWSACRAPCAKSDFPITLTLIARRRRGGRRQGARLRNPRIERKTKRAT
jgi:hypothetical protein